MGFSAGCPTTIPRRRSARSGTREPDAPVRECVLDASVVLTWFIDAGTTLRGEYESGNLAVVAPTLIHLEILNVAGRRWRWEAQALQELAEALDDLSFDLVDPDLAKVATWVAAGLTAYDAAYVAVAEAAAIPLFTSDERILSVAPRIARPPGP
jgi:predicted nucleic acid-binding protein